MADYNYVNVKCARLKISQGFWIILICNVRKKWLKKTFTYS